MHTTLSISFGAGPESAADGMTLAPFLDELRHVARFVTAKVSPNPLDAVLTAIRQNPAMLQARLLTRILAATIGRQVTFRHAEAAAFDREHLALLVALMDVRSAGTITETDWVRAAEDADAAQQGIGG